MDAVLPKDPSSCPICLDDFHVSEGENDIHQSRCGHPVHRHCLQVLMRSGNYNCSICRNPFGEVPTEQNQPRLKRYIKMLQQNLPVAAVRQRMEADRIAPHVIDAFFTGGVSLMVQDEAETKSESVIQPLNTAKYAMMLKVGMKIGAVRQKMEAAGFSKEDIEKFSGKLIEEPSK